MSYAPPFARIKRARHIPSHGTQAAVNPREDYASLDELNWDPKWNKTQLREVIRKRRLVIPDRAKKKDMIRFLEEDDESQPKDVIAALQARGG